MFSLQIVQSPSFSYSEKYIDDINKNISNSIDIAQFWTVNIVFLDSDGIQKLNNDYRQKDSVTDVLSFHYHDDYSDLKTDDIAWEIIMCEEKIHAQWEEFGLWEEYEFYKLLIHSLLHLLGFDHEDDEEYEEMKKWEEKIWNQTFWS